MAVGNDAGMSARLKGRRRAVNALLVDVERWAAEHDDVKAVALVGSYARGAERMASDFDLMILAEDRGRGCKWGLVHATPPRRAVRQSRELGAGPRTAFPPTVRTPRRTEFRERKLGGRSARRGHSTRSRRRPPNPVRHGASSLSLRARQELLDEHRDGLRNPGRRNLRACAALPSSRSTVSMGAARRHSRKILQHSRMHAPSS